MNVYLRKSKATNLLIQWFLLYNVDSIPLSPVSVANTISVLCVYLLSPCLLFPYASLI